MRDRLRVAFVGVNLFGGSALTALIEDPYVDVAGVWTQHFEGSCVATTAAEHGLPTHVVRSMKDGSPGAASLREAAVDLVIMCNFSMRLGTEALTAAPLGVVNFHPSLLPRHRGPNPVKWTLKVGDTQSGVTAMFTDDDFDTGPLIDRETVPVEPDDDEYTLTYRIGDAITRLTARILHVARSGTLVGHPQDATQATYAPFMTEDDYRLCWQEPAEGLELTSRISNPPGSWFLRDEEKLRVARTRIEPSTGHGVPGTVLEGGSAPLVLTGRGALRIVSWGERVERLTAGQVLG